MDLKLTPEEIRVLGVLLEKEMQTPDYYPLTLNALVTGCNQKSSREPVMQLKEGDVEKAVNGLKRHQLAWRMDSAYGRVAKYEHNAIVKWKLNRKELAAFCVILLRGPQTVGEIKGRTKRMAIFDSLTEVGDVIKVLIEREDGALITELPREPGRKEKRFDITFRAQASEVVSGTGVATLSSPPPELSGEDSNSISATTPIAESIPPSEEQEIRIQTLENRLEKVEEELARATRLLNRLASELGID